MNPSLLPDEKLRLRGEKKGLMDLVQKVVCVENGVSVTLRGCVIDTRRNSLASKRKLLPLEGVSIVPVHQYFKRF